MQGPLSQGIVMSGVGGGVAARKECEESARSSTRFLTVGRATHMSLQGDNVPFLISSMGKIAPISQP